MMKKTHILNRFLLLICILAFIQISFSINLYIKTKSHFLELLSHTAYSISTNLDVVLSQAKTDDTFSLAIGGARIYLADLPDHFRITDYALRFNVLWKEYYFLEGLGNAYMATTYIQEKFEAIYLKYMDGNTLDESDFTYLLELKEALDELHISIRNEDGSLNQKATKQAYFVEQFNKFISAIYN